MSRALTSLQVESYLRLEEDTLAKTVMTATELLAVRVFPLQVPVEAEVMVGRVEMGEVLQRFTGPAGAAMVWLQGQLPTGLLGELAQTVVSVGTAAVPLRLWPQVQLQ